MRIFWNLGCCSNNTHRRHSGRGHLSRADDGTHDQREAISAEPPGVNQTGSSHAWDGPALADTRGSTHVTRTAGP